MQIWAAFVGKKVKLTTSSGAVYRGVLYYSGPRVVLTNLAFFSRSGQVWIQPKRGEFRSFFEDKVKSVVEGYD